MAGILLERDGIEIFTPITKTARERIVMSCGCGQSCQSCRGCESCRSCDLLYCLGSD